MSSAKLVFFFFLLSVLEDEEEEVESDALRRLDLVSCRSPLRGSSDGSVCAGGRVSDLSHTAESLWMSADITITSTINAQTAHARMMLMTDRKRSSLFSNCTRQWFPGNQSSQGSGVEGDGGAGGGGGSRRCASGDDDDATAFAFREAFVDSKDRSILNTETARLRSPAVTHSRPCHTHTHTVIVI